MEGWKRTLEGLVIGQMSLNYKSNRNNTMEIIKFFAAVGVIMLHYAFPGIVGKVIYGLARFGVPFFLMISGYYIYDEDSGRVISKLPEKIMHILKIWLITDIFYGIYYFALNGFRLSYFADELARWGKGRWYSFLVFQNTWLGFTWFLFGMIICYLLTFIIARMKLWKATWLLTAPLLLVNLYIGEILPFYRGEESIWFWCSNAWLLAFPFFSLGYFVRINEKKLLELITGKRTVVLLIVSFCINMVERALTHANQLFFSNICICLVLFLYCLKYPHEYDCRDGWSGKICRWLIFMGNMSMYIYLIHPAIKEMVIRIRRATNTEEGIIAGYIGTLMVLIGTLLIVHIIGTIITRKNDRLK